MITEQSFSYLGSFTFPSGTEYAGHALALDPVSQTVYLGSEKLIYKCKWPPVAGAVLQIDDAAVRQDGWQLTSLLALDGILYGTTSLYYDAEHRQKVSHFAQSLEDLGDPYADPPALSKVWDKPGFTSGNLAIIPKAWQAKLGGTMLSGQCGLPIVSRNSLGPAAFAFNHELIGQPEVPATPLVYYDLAHPTLGTWDNKTEANERYNMSTQITGLFLIEDYAVFVGKQGLGIPCYGAGTDDPDLAGYQINDTHYCFDPLSVYKGTHAYPYRYQVWVYSLHDFALVKEGKVQPWEVQPIAILPLPITPKRELMGLGGCAYDPTSQKLYVVERDGDFNGVSARPVVHVLQVSSFEQPKDDDAEWRTHVDQRLAALESWQSKMREASK